MGGVFYIECNGRAVYSLLAFAVDCPLGRFNDKANGNGHVPGFPDNLSPFKKLNIFLTLCSIFLMKPSHSGPYKIQLVQVMEPRDLTMRFHFDQWANGLTFSDDDHFQLGIFFSTNNCCIWGSENQHIV